MSYHSQSAVDVSHPGPTSGEFLALQIADAYLDWQESLHTSPEYADARVRLEKLSALGHAWRRVSNFSGPKTRAAIAVALAEADRCAGLRFKGTLVSDEVHKAYLADFRKFAGLYEDICLLIAEGYIEERA